MPAIIGPVQIINVGSGIVQFGDAVYISPKHASKSVSGAGASNTGGFIITNNGININNVIDTNLLDQPVVGNA
ncbi:hypothetical protein CVD25_05630 [Bacillus canaveralius]|uniref:Uncharacterized protein n=1 Tax=Bacillus canaveralius TaxID=1403243 RepID=A0A2N5GKA3_9BACI|nr:MULTISPECIES: spore germination protein [Bacillus]PLR81963.1 hypothetical protein CU635_12335 [Bacillus canaveralius]PLR87367.1 hypothetical protein CVD23_03030 [Bacillus sp. V33-4]PLR99349.1 hypothetical protein CVD25_05630 [Bacillus canaveralius]RSK46930.1 spore germination protein [Bacillus canaveralius]